MLLVYRTKVIYLFISCPEDIHIFLAFCWVRGHSAFQESSLNTMIVAKYLPGLKLLCGIYTQLYKK